MTNKTAIVFNANDPQISQAHLFIESLRDPSLGNYNGDIWIVSTCLSPNSKRYFDSIQLRYIENSMDFLWDWKGWRIAAEYTLSIKPKPNPVPVVDTRMMRANISNCVHYLLTRAVPFFFKSKAPTKKEALRMQQEAKRAEEQENLNKELQLEQCFIEYRNKRLSKLLFLDFLDLYGDDYEKVILCDTDILIQTTIANVFEQVVDDKLYYWREENPILPGTSLWKKNLAYKKLISNGMNSVDFGRNEINIGFLAGKTKIVQKVLSLQKDLYLEEAHIDLIKFGWHEQDFFRLLRGLRPDLFALFREGTIVHLCNGGEMLIKEINPMGFNHVILKDKPTVIHFAGGTWSMFDSINKTYRLDAEEYLSYYLNR